MHPLPLIKFMANKESSREGVGLSATGIIACARQNVLLTETDYYEDPDNFMAAFRGEIWHDGFEKWLRDEPDITSETRLEKAVEIILDGESIWVVLSGKPDQVHRPRGLVTDTKSVGRNVVCDPVKLSEKQYDFCERMRLKEPYPEHEAQVNIYAWMHREGHEVGTGLPVDVRITRGGIIYIGNDGKRSRKFPVRIWSDEEQDAYVAARVRPRAIYERTGELPDLLPAERIIKARNTGKKYVKRNFKCDFCPVRSTCDALALARTGLDPNTPEYWEAIRGNGEGDQGDQVSTLVADGRDEPSAPVAVDPGDSAGPTWYRVQ